MTVRKTQADAAWAEALARARLKELLEDLHQAALGYGAVHCPEYKDARIKELRRRAKRRLEAAAGKYHSHVLSLAFVAKRKLR